LRIGAKTPQQWARAVRNRSNYGALLRAFQVQEEPLRVLFGLCVPSRRYPVIFRVRTPTGPIGIKLFRYSDVGTLNLVFSRQDYVCPADAKVVVDVGSNIGISAAFFLTRNRSAFAYLFEPSPNNLPRLRENMQQFQGRYELRDVAIADRAGDVVFAMEESGLRGRIQGPGGNEVVVRAEHVNAALSPIVSRHGSIDCLKLDIEGYEERVLNALDPELWPLIRVLNVEALHRFACIPDYFRADVWGSAFRYWNTRF
jgi:FkbM family methyltransferase